MDTEKKKDIGKVLANVVCTLLGGGEALDGDDTEDIAKYFLDELDGLMANV